MIDYTGKNRKTVNYLKTIYFDNPEWTQCGVSIMTATWMKYRDEVEEIALRHPKLFPGMKKGGMNFDFPSLPPLYELGNHTDTWGTVWNNIERGLDSIPVQCPLEDWSAFDTWEAPDSLVEGDFDRRDWNAIAKALDATGANGNMRDGGGLGHGFFFMRLYYLRGFENLMLDMATDDSRLGELIKVVEDFCVRSVQKYLELGVDHVSGGEDLGMQHALPVSPDAWRKFVKPTYEAIFGPCRDRGIPVYLHSDGHILEIIPDLVDTGITCINPQIRANGLDEIERQVKGKVAISLDLDRQLFPFSSPAETEDHIFEAYEALHMPEGGLMLGAECEPDVPLENIEVICCALEKVGNLPDPETL